VISFNLDLDGQGGPLTTPNRSSPDPAAEVPDAGDLRLRYYPDPVLAQRCRPLGAPGPAAQACIQRMFELMYEHQGIGLAAPQVGWNVRALGFDGEPFELETDDLLARCIQHENDHIDGILITARVSTLQRIAIRSDLRELKSQWDKQEGRT